MTTKKKQKLRLKKINNKKPRIRFRKVKMEIYKCQFCGEESPAKDWKEDKCPKCGEEYNVQLAQDSEE